MDDASRRLFEEAAGTDAEPNPEPDEDRQADGIPREVFALTRRWRYPPGTPIVRRRQLEQEYWTRAVRDVWPQIPAEALGGRTPRQAADDPELRLPLTAALYVLDAFCE